MILLTALLTRCAAGGDPIQDDDWLVSWSGKQPTLTAGSIGAVHTLTLQNGLISRAFTLPFTAGSAAAAAAPNSPVGPGCSNPGGRMVSRPDGSEYPYYGMSCVSRMGEKKKERSARTSYAHFQADVSGETDPCVSDIGGHLRPMV